jgi:hypothetical protein
MYTQQLCLWTSDTHRLQLSRGCWGTLGLPGSALCTSWARPPATTTAAQAATSPTPAIPAPTPTASSLVAARLLLPVPTREPLLAGGPLLALLCLPHVARRPVEVRLGAWHHPHHGALLLLGLGRRVVAAAALRPCCCRPLTRVEALVGAATEVSVAVLLLLLLVGVGWARSHGVAPALLLLLLVGVVALLWVVRLAHLTTPPLPPVASTTPAMPPTARGAITPTTATPPTAPATAPTRSSLPVG